MGGEHSVNFSEAGAARTESTRVDTLGAQLAQIDVAMYIDWVTALSDELATGAVTEASLSPYTPTHGTVSGFLDTRFREEFLPAVDTWLATEPIVRNAAPKTPFEMDEYVSARLVEVKRLTAVAGQMAMTPGRQIRTATTTS